MVNVILGGICFIVAIILTCRLHVYAFKRIVSMIATDNYFGGGVLSLKSPSPIEINPDYEIETMETGFGDKDEPNNKKE
jgi:hypothetical protein